MGTKEEITPNALEELGRAENAPARHVAGTEDLLSAMGAISDQDVTQKADKPRKAHWRQILIACCCILAIAAAAKAFLYLNAEIGALTKEINTLMTQLSATGTREQLGTVRAQIQDLRTTNTQLRAELAQLEETIETLKARKSNVAATQPNRKQQPAKKIP